MKGMCRFPDVRAHSKLYLSRLNGTTQLNCGGGVKNRGNEKPGRGRDEPVIFSRKEKENKNNWCRG